MEPPSCPLIMWLHVFRCVAFPAISALAVISFTCICGLTRPTEPLFLRQGPIVLTTPSEDAHGWLNLSGSLGSVTDVTDRSLSEKPFLSLMSQQVLPASTSSPSIIHQHPLPHNSRLNFINTYLFSSQCAVTPLLFYSFLFLCHMYLWNSEEITILKCLFYPNENCG